MSMSALLSTLRGAGRHQLSATTVTAWQATGSHLFRIDGYTQASKIVCNSGPVRSDTLSVGGHDWRLLCYPNGSYFGCSGISHLIEHQSDESTWDKGKVLVKAQASILDSAGMPSYTQTMTDFATFHCDFGWNNFISHKELDKQKHLKDDDCLSILCELTVVTGKCAKIAGGPRVPFDLHGELVEAIWNKEEPDVRIQVSGETLAAHRWILVALSPVFAQELELSSELLVDDMDAEVFKAMLQFIYTDSPPLLEAATAAERLLVAADRYELEKLKRACEEALCRHIDVGSVAATLALAEQHDCRVLREACMRFLSSPGNLEAVLAPDGFELLKTGCPSALLELVLKNMIRHEQLTQESCTR
ncbi:BTB/POZ and MATH domain-containing protein 1-like [Aegilops tauschii subsp. strangulata]|uniref:TD and POZ domain-containing protein 4 n=1 Tax=Aegilops tauschii TaxID=37682 RepID=M8BTK3_AEGTA|nr:BTB/POZ and MATH domain-containing protein 1-like [Aegilops tauschii subsp. strangulata]